MTGDGESWATGVDWASGLAGDDEGVGEAGGVDSPIIGRLSR